MEDRKGGGDVAILYFRSSILDGLFSVDFDALEAQGVAEGGGVVDSVADHGDGIVAGCWLLVASGLEFADHLGLLVGFHLGADVVDADLFGDQVGGGAVVAGEEDGAEIHGVEGGDGGGGV